MMEFNCLDAKKLSNYIDRARKFNIEIYETYLYTLFENVFSEMAEFVNAQGILLLLDEPKSKIQTEKQIELTYVAIKGKNLNHLIGKSVPSNVGLLGEVYTLGRSNIKNVQDSGPVVIDKFHMPKECKNVLATPIKIETSSIGVLVAFNKMDAIGFTLKDLRLIQIFSGYISTSLQNAIDARKSKELTKRDDLTGLYNDRFFHRQLTVELDNAIKAKHPLCLVFMDLDHFKSINDQYGHLVGSQTLREIGFILRDCVDIEESILARYGGDEYVLIFPNVELDQAVMICEKIRKAIFEHFFMIPVSNGAFVNFKGRISASIGVASLFDHISDKLFSQDIKNLFIKLADTAMYDAKAKGKNQVCVAQKANTNF